ncbi:MAG: 50S ribosomal protein L19 [Bacteriovoracales bacterium]|nr:50S ribosomal protein L19 [Bacteriovoracales bacterium]
MNLVDQVEKNHAKAGVSKTPIFRSGDTLSVHVRIKEGSKSRIQVFQGVCIGIKQRNDLNGHFRVRKISGGIGVERLFPFHSPNVEKIQVDSRGKTRRAKHYYLRKRSGKSARIAVDYSRQD